jgi:hypothetical protein
MKKTKIIYSAILFVIISFPFLMGSGGAGPEYKCSKIPASLLKDAKSVLRNDDVRFEVVSKKKAIETIKYAITIFSKEERDKGNLVLYYNDLIKIKDLEGVIYDANGVKVREMESDEVKDYSASGEYELYSDARVKTVGLYYDSYPYTVEYKYSVYYKGYIDWPEWVTQSSLEPVEHTSFEVLIDKEKDLRYWKNSDSLKPDISIVDGQKKYYWHADNLPKLSKDVVGEEEEDYAGVVKIAPDEYEIAGAEGKMSSWKEFGSWYYNLCKGKDKLPEEAKKEIAALIKTDDDTVAKIKKLYEYMQKRTHYVSVQLGIGGWMPFDATYVHERGYGDCKALANYMQAILKEAGIASYQTLINSGTHAKPITLELPANQFDHVILCVPVKTDTLWLECTSQTIPMGLIHSSIINRYALLVSEEGGKIVHTPPTCPNDNLQIRKSTVNIESNGNAMANSATNWKGIPQDYFIEMYHDSSPEEREKWALNEIDIPNINLKNLEFSGVDSAKGDVQLYAKIELHKYASLSGERLFFLPNLMEKRKYAPPTVKKRLSPVRLSYPYHDVDTVVFSVPEDFTVEAIPPEADYKSSFGKFHSKSAYENNKLIFTRSLEIFNCTIPASEYTEYQNFFTSIVKADKAQVVLIKKKQP